MSIILSFAVPFVVGALLFLAIRQQATFTATLTEKRGKTLVYKVTCRIGKREVGAPTTWLIPCELGLYSSTSAVNEATGEPAGATKTWWAIQSALNLDKVNGNV